MMVRTRNARREDTTLNPTPTDGRAETESPQAPPLPPAPALPRVETHQAVIEARRRLGDAEEKLTAAAKRVSEVAEQTEAARDRLRELEKLLVLDEVGTEEVEAARRDLARLEPQLAEARAVARSWRDAIADLTVRVERATVQARQEVAATLAELRREAVADQARALAGLRAAALRLYEVERAIQQEGFSLPGGALAIGEVLDGGDGLRLRHPDHVLPVHPADPIPTTFGRRARAAGFEVEDLT